MKNEGYRIGIIRWGRKANAALILLVGLAMALGAGRSLGQSGDSGVDSGQDEPSDLGEKLIRQAVGEADDGDVMAQIIGLMRATARRLVIQFDPGPQTQAMQARILKQLNTAIKQAKMQTKRIRQKQQQSADVRKMPKAQGPKGDSQRSDEHTGRSSDSTSTTGITNQTGNALRQANDEPLNERRRRWGNLPLRDREEVIQGVGEAVLQRFSDWIDRYYRALQSADENNGEYGE